jgi:hypothetical protein
MSKIVEKAVMLKQISMDTDKPPMDVATEQTAEQSSPLGRPVWELLQTTIGVAIDGTSRVREIIKNFQISKNPQGGGREIAGFPCSGGTSSSL